jgi:hypothetical protein
MKTRDNRNVTDQPITATADGYRRTRVVGDPQVFGLTVQRGEAAQ